MSPNQSNLQLLKEKYRIALEALNDIARNGGKVHNNTPCTGLWASKRASAALVLMTTQDTEPKQGEPTNE